MLFTSIPVAGLSSTRSSTQWVAAVGEEARGRKAAPQAPGCSETGPRRRGQVGEAGRAVGSWAGGVHSWTLFRVTEVNLGTWLWFPSCLGNPAWKIWIYIYQQTVHLEGSNEQRKGRGVGPEQHKLVGHCVACLRLGENIAIRQLKHEHDWCELVLMLEVKDEHDWASHEVTSR